MHLKPIELDYLLLTKQGTAWLDNFQPKDLNAARLLVKGLTLVSLSKFARTIGHMVRTEAGLVNGPVALFAVREVTQNTSYFDQAITGSGRRKKVKTVDAVGRGADIGSEGLVASILRNIGRQETSKFLNHPTVANMRENKCRTIIVVDDLIGSGKRTREFLDAIWLDRTIRSWWSLGYIRFKVIAFAGTRMGIYRVKRATYGPTVSVDRDCPTFSGLPWRESQRMQITQLCETYAPKTSKSKMGLGYGDTMASLVFEHGCPNNAPAIIWASGSKDAKWQPLFPNRSVSQHHQSIFPLEVVRRDPISVLVDAGQSKLAETDLQRIGSVESEQFLMLMALIAKGIRRNDALTYATGLSNAELETILGKCINWGMITLTRRITSTGRAELEHIRHTKRLEPEVPPLSGETYYPKQLRGPTSG